MPTFIVALGQWFDFGSMTEAGGAWTRWSGLLYSRAKLSRGSRRVRYASPLDGDLLFICAQRLRTLETQPFLNPDHPPVLACISWDSTCHCEKRGRVWLLLVES